jgi:glucokinase
VACPTEGSHVDFAPRTPVEYALWRHLAREHGHVSYERVASGSTLATLYKFVRRHQRVPESKAAAASFASAVDPNLAVVDLALAGESEAAMRAVELWSSVYGAEAGNLVLKSMATSGLFVCGGVSARLATVLAEGLPGRSKGRRRAAEGSPFLRAFFDKGRMRPLLESVPVAVCTEPLAGLLGAAADAAQRAAIQSPARPRRPLGGGKARRSPSL